MLLGQDLFEGHTRLFRGMVLTCHIEDFMIITVPYGHICRFFLKNSNIYHVKSCILLKPVLQGVDGNLQFSIQFMNRPNQKEPATFSIFLFYAFNMDSNFSLFYIGRVC
jgi:hypothetical protein